MLKKALLLFLIMVAEVSAQTLKIATVEGLPGFEVENGKLIAASPYPEFIAALEKELEVTLVWSSYPTKRLLAMAKNGEIDLIYPMGFNAERDAILKRSEPSEPPTHDYLVYKTKPSNVGDLSLTVGCKAGSPQENWLRARGYQVIIVQDYEVLIKRLLLENYPMIALPQVAFEELNASSTFLYEISATRDVGFYYTPKFALAPDFDKAITKHRNMFKTK